MSRAVVLLDVDGPLNPTEAKLKRRPEGYTTHRLRPRGFEYTKQPLRVWLAPEHGPQLLAWAEENDFELAWGTTWVDEANTMIGPVIGLPWLPYVPFLSHPGSHPEWKYPETEIWLAGRPAIWFDDEFNSSFPNSRRAQAKAAFLKARADIPTVLHHVDPRIGLTVLDLSAAARKFNKEST